MRRRAQTLVSVAGFDPSAGAGVLLDIGVFNRCGFHGSAVLTSVTVQNTRGVEKAHNLPASLILEQFSFLRRDVSVSGVKVGMLGGAEGIRAMKEILERTKSVPRVVDPVLRSSSGFWLMKKELLPAFLAAVRNRASLLTPNLFEAELISGLKARDVGGLKHAARRIQEMTGVPCLLKGGHLESRIADVLFDGRRFFVFHHRKIRRDAHGTGCFLSAAALARLAAGDPLERACRSAVALTVEALAATSAVGRGRPVFTVHALRKGTRRSPHPLSE